MRSSSHWHLIMYDIRSPKRLRRVHRYLKSCAYPIQESVFAWCGNAASLLELQSELRQRLNLREDDVRGYRLHTHGVFHFWGPSPFLQGIYDSGYPPYKHYQLLEAQDFDPLIWPDRVA